MKRALVLGAGGFIGGHLTKRLCREGLWVRGVDRQRPRYAPSPAQHFLLGDLRDPALCAAAFEGGFDEVYQLAAEMGGAGFISTGTNDAEIMRSSALINVNVLRALRPDEGGGKTGRASRVFYASSACVYPERNQLDPSNPRCSEDSVYPAAPDSEYGWEKLFAERLYLSHARNLGLGVRIARFHNVFGPEGSWNDGREKAPAALCRKIAAAAPGGAIEIWGDGLQTRSFLHIDEALEAVLRLMRSDCAEPLNIGSEQMVTINQLARMIMEVAQKPLGIRNVPGPTGVRGRTSDNRLIRARLGWSPTTPLSAGLAETYGWIAGQVKAGRGDRPAEDPRPEAHGPRP